MHQLPRLCRIVQVQPSGSEVLQLALTVDLTLANYVWQSLVVAGGSSMLDIAAYWHAAAEVLALDLNWSTLRLAGQSSRLRFVALDHAEAIPEDLAMASPDMGASGWCSAPAATRTVLLMVSTVMRLRFMLQSSLSTDACTRIAAADLGQKLDQIRQRQTSAQPAQRAAAPSDAQHAALRRALLLVKAASIVTSLSVHEASIPLWSAASSTFDQVKESGKPTAQDGTESQSLTVLVVQLVVSALKKFVKVKTAKARTAAHCCCSILQSLMPSSWPALHQVAAAELISSGQEHLQCTRHAPLYLVHVLLCCFPDFSKSHKWLRSPGRSKVLTWCSSVYDMPQRAAAITVWCLYCLPERKMVIYTQ